MPSIWSRITEVLAAIGDSISEFFQRLTSGLASPPEESVAFTIGMIALSAKMAKADGVVSMQEIRAFKDVFHIPPEELANVARVYNLAKQDVAGYESYARQVAKLFWAEHEILEDVLDGLFHIAKSDGVVHDRELHYLERVAAIFGFDAREFAGIRARHVHTPADDPYGILGVSPGAPDREIKARYRTLVRDNHPDRHIAAGMPEELVAIATERLAAINAAYERIARERGL
jgi:DnaJ like chaperone protein